MCDRPGYRPTQGPWCEGDLTRTSGPARYVHVVESVLDASAIVGVVPLVISAVGAVAIGGLLLRRGRAWWLRAVPVALVAAVVGTAIADLVVDDVWQPFPDPLPLRVLLWGALGLTAVGLAVAGLRTGGRWRRAVTVPLVVVALLLPAMKINAFYGYLPTVRDALGIPAPNAVDLADLPAAEPTVAPDAWTASPDLRDAGGVTTVDIPSPLSGFPARPGVVYLPPAYLDPVRRPLLPVLVMIAGQPGGPQDWLVAGKLAPILDAFAAKHAGLAPVVVVPDATGASFANPLCLDSALGSSAGYLTRDVPAWIRAHLQVDPDPAHWAIGGFSFGGTCALQLAVQAPEVYPTFLDISGQREPTLGTRQQTADAAFGGDQSRLLAQCPLTVLGQRRFPHSTAMVAVGDSDDLYGPDAAAVRAAAVAAGMTVDAVTVPGGHSWTVARAALGMALPILGSRLGLVGAGPAEPPVLPGTVGSG
jgi:S-formylglutathione hydrolase FrmB